jgi:uncharacterized protein (TIGR00369 family)
MNQEPDAEEVVRNEAPGGDLAPLFHGAHDAAWPVVATATISDLYEGPPGYLHGGIIATLLDEAMSKANRARGVTAMTRQMTVEYLRPVPSGAAIRIEGRVSRSEGRKHWTDARIVGVDGATLAQASGLFLAMREPR